MWRLCSGECVTASCPLMPTYLGVLFQAAKKLAAAAPAVKPEEAAADEKAKRKAKIEKREAKRQVGLGLFGQHLIC